MKRISFGRLVSLLLTAGMLFGMLVITPAASAEVLLNEPFAAAEADIGRELVGWNGWSGGYANPSGSITVRDSEYTLTAEPEDETNQVLKIYRPTAGSTSINFIAEKALSETVTGGIVHYSMRLQKRTDTNTMFKLCLMDSAGFVQEITINLRLNEVTCGPTEFNLPMVTVLNTWYTFDLYIDVDNNTFTMYASDAEGRKLARSDVEMMMGTNPETAKRSNGTLKTIGLSTNRNASGMAGSIFLVDDVSVSELAAMELIGSDPADGADNAEPSEPIVLTFSQPVDEGMLSVDNVSISGVEVSSAVVDEQNSNQVIVTPTEPLDYETSYTVSISGITDIYGQTAENASISFTTRASVAFYTEPKFYLNYTGAKTDITASGLRAGEITAEVGVVNESDESSDVFLVLQIMRGGKCAGIVSEKFALPVASHTETKAMVAAQVQAGDVLEFHIIDSWNSLMAEAGAYILDQSGMKAEPFTSASGAVEIFAAMNYDTGKVDITGTAKTPGSAVMAAILNPGFIPEQVNGTNAAEAVYSLMRFTAGADGAFTASLDSDAFVQDVAYTVLASGGKTAALIVRDKAIVQSALDKVQASGIDELAGLLEGEKEFQNGLYLNDIIQLDLSQYLLLSEPEKVLEAMAGKRFADLDALRSAYRAVLEKQTAFEKRAREVIGRVNGAAWDEMMRVLEDGGDVLKLDWGGDYAKLSEKKRDMMFRALAGGYNFASLSEIESAFRAEAAKALAADDGGDEQSVILQEDFEVEDSELGREALGWNGWGGGYSAPSAGITVEDSEYTLIAEPGNAQNKVLQMYRPTSAASSIQYMISKDLPEIQASGVVQLDLKLQRTSANAEYFQVLLYDHANALWTIQILMKTSRISCGQMVNFIGNTGNNPGTELGKWYEFTFYFNLDDSLLSVYQGGTPLATGIGFPSNYKASIKTLALNTHRTAAGVGANFLIDDIVMQKVGAMQLVASSPADGAQNVDTSEAMAFSFSQDVDASSLCADNVIIGGVPAASVTVDPADGRKILAEPAQPLNFESAVQVRVTGVRDVFGQTAPDAELSFTTRAGKLNVTDPAFYLDYEGTRTDITASGVRTGSITAELDMVNETPQAQEANLVLQTVRRGKTHDVASKAYQVTDKIDSATVSAAAQTGQELHLTVIGSWDTLLAKSGMYILDAHGMRKEAFGFSEAVSRVHAAVNDATGELELTGRTDSAGATVTLAVLNPGYLPTQITEANAGEAVYCLVQTVSGADGAYQAATDVSGMKEGASYTILASGGKTTKAFIGSSEQIQTALASVKNASAEELDDLLAGKQVWQGGIFLNDVLQLDLTDYLTLEDRSGICGKLAGRSFDSLELLRSVYSTALQNQITREARIRDLVSQANAAGWEKLESILRSFSDVVDIDWDGSYAKLNADKKVVMFKILAKDYTFTSEEDIERAFAAEADKQLEIQESEKDKDDSGSGKRGGGGGGSLSVRQDVEPIVIPTLPPLEIPDDNKPGEEKDFVDLDTVPWAEESIKALSEAGIINGVGGGRFAPNDFVTREQFVKMIVLGFELSGSAPLSFTDVDNGAWYAPYLSAAVEHDVVQGLGDGSFGVGAYISRSDIAVMCTRIAESCGVKLPEAGEADYRDAVLIPDYAQESAAALQAAGIMTGDESRCFDPSANATRAMAAKVIYMLLSLADAA